MDTLPNVNTRRGENKPSHVGLTSNVYPEVLNPQAENSRTGVTSNFVPKENHEWFVLRILYGHTKDVVDAFKKEDILYYIPKRYQKVEVPPTRFFAYITRTHDFVKQPSKTASFLKYYTDKTKPIESDTQLNPPITIPDDRMKSFINVVETKNEHILATSKDRCHFKSSNFFQVVCEDFIVGQVVRAAGQQRIA